MNQIQKFFHHLSVQKKLLWVLVGVNLLCILIILLSMLFYQKHTFKQHLQTYAQEQAALMASNVSAAMLFDDKKTVNEALGILQYAPFIHRAEVLLTDQTLYAHYQIKKASSLSNARLNHRPSDDQYLIVQFPIQVKQEKLGTLYLALSLEGLYQALWWFTGMTLMAGIVGMSIAFKLAQRLNHVITKPLVELTDLMQSLDKQPDFHLRSNINTRDEIGRLATGFNQLMDHLQSHAKLLQNELRQRELAEERLEYLANVDSVTNMPNRHAFNARLQNTLAQYQSPKTLALMFIDLDNFKIVNDTLGHHAGDQLLQMVSVRLEQSVGTQGQAFRIGGDEFAVILPDTMRQFIAHLATDIINQLNQPFSIQDNQVHVGASIGVSLYPEHADSQPALMRRADEAMYHAKSLNKNNYQFFSQEMEGRTERRNLLESGLSEAIRLNQLEVYYQPIVDLHSQALLGMEALVRWQHPQLGMISPIEFIQIAEESGLIVPLGKWVLHTACEQMQAWHSQYIPSLHLTVNISANQFKDKNWIEMLSNTLEITQLKADCLHLELIESALMTNPEISIPQMHRSRALGVNLSIDDFGMEYSSLSYLNKLPLTTIKIDKSFIRNLPEQKENTAITRAILSIAKDLELNVVIEGIETLAQLEYLQQHANCAGQGFLFHRPMPAAEIECTILKPNDQSLLTNMAVNQCAIISE